jgi:hypothetical protein
LCSAASLRFSARVPDVIELREKNHPSGFLK